MIHEMPILKVKLILCYPVLNVNCFIWQLYQDAIFMYLNYMHSILESKLLFSIVSGKDELIFFN